MRRVTLQGRVVWQDNPGLNQDPVNTIRGRGLKKTREARGTKNGMARDMEKTMEKTMEKGRDLTSII
jgi:hypothetical protein